MKSHRALSSRAEGTAVRSFVVSLSNRAEHAALISCQLELSRCRNFRSCPSLSSVSRGNGWGNQMHELIELEEQGWRVLSSAGEDGKKFYASVLREDAVMLFADGMRIVGRENILRSLGTQPWESFRIEDSTVIPLTSHCATVIYAVTAQRKGSAPYRALIGSTYVLDHNWQLVLHQQTPA
jgi:uncharacterized protein DUF4440